MTFKNTLTLRTKTCWSSHNRPSLIRHNCPRTCLVCFWECWLFYMCLYLFKYKVYFFLNGIKTLEQNILNFATNTHATSRTGKYFVFCLLQWMSNAENRCPRLLCHFSSIMRFPVSSEDQCHRPRYVTTHTRYSVFFFCYRSKKELVQMCSTLPHIRTIHHQKARIVNCKYVQQHSSDDPKLRQNIIRFNALQNQLDLKRSRPLRIG